MTTLAIGNKATVSIPRENKDHWGEVVNKVKSVFGIVTSAIEPYFAATRLERLDSDYRTSLSIKEKAFIDANANGIPPINRMR